MSCDQADPRLRQEPARQVFGLAVLASAAFVYVSAETLPVGLLPQLSAGLHVSDGAVGLLVTAYTDRRPPGRGGVRARPDRRAPGPGRPRARLTGRDGGRRDRVGGGVHRPARLP